MMPAAAGHAAAWLKATASPQIGQQNPSALTAKSPSTRPTTIVARQILAGQCTKLWPTASLVTSNPHSLSRPHRRAYAPRGFLP
jgi:hypothetical protein